MYKRQVEYLLDILLFGETEEKAALIADYGKDVPPIVDEARQCDRIAFINEGRIHGIDTPDCILKQFADLSLIHI